VRAQVLDGWKALRACTIPSYLYACREVVARAVEDDDGTSNLCIAFPPNTTINARSQTIVLKDAMLGEKVTIKSSTIGRSCKISAKCRLNNVVLMDNVVVKENCILQNSILGKGCTIGENCNLNDCQVAADKVVPAGMKEKGESLIDAL
jgi:translation initiation factor eIF-2B subunit gamma